MIDSASTGGRAVIGVALAALVAFAMALSGGFVNWDDPWLILDNPYLKGFEHVGTIFNPMVDRMALGAEYLPVRDLSNLVDYSLFGPDPTGYRLGNWLLHALASTACYVFLREALGNSRAALAGALVWAVHPLGTEAVAWASARKDLLVHLFALLAGAFHLRAARTRDLRWSFAAFGAFLLATLSKSSAATVPVALALIEFVRFPREGETPVRRAMRCAVRAAPMLALAALGAWVNARLQSNDYRPPDWHGGDYLVNLFLSAEAHLRYLRQWVWPAGLSPDYAASAEVTDRIATFLGVAVVVAGLVVTAALLRLRPVWGGALGWWFVVLLPVSNILHPIANLAADRYAILPAVGLAALSGLVFAAAERRWRVPARAAGVAVLVALSLVTARQSGYWKNGRALWGRAAAAEPDCPRAWQNFGSALFAAGERREAVRAFKRMVEAGPWEAMMWTNVGRRMANLAGSDLLPEVDELFRTALLRAAPTEGGPFLAYAVFLDATGRPDESVVHLHSAMERSPKLGEVWFSRGRKRFLERDPEGAREDLRKALECGLPLPLVGESEEMLGILDGATGR